MYALNNSFKIQEQNVIELEGGIKTFAIITRYFNTLLSVINRTSRQKIRIFKTTLATNLIRL